VVGGDGTGTRFGGNTVHKDADKASLFDLPDDALFYEPQPGYHTTLVQQDPKNHPDEFDYFTKDHVRYHFKLNPYLKPYGDVYVLQFIEDTNGNQINLYYDPKDPRGEKKERALPMWKYKVLSVDNLAKHRQYRNDELTQEQSCEAQLDYLSLFTEQHRSKLKAAYDVAKMFRIGGQAAHGCGAPMALGLPTGLQAFPFADNTLRFETGPFDVDVLDEEKQPGQYAATLGALAAPLGPAPGLSFFPNFPSVDTRLAIW